MPDMDGVETTLRIREMGKKMPVIALTANAVVGMREMFLQNGFNDYISKPIDIDTLNDVLEKWIPASKRLAPLKKPVKDENEININLRIPGIDVSQGLALTGGTLQNYMQALAMFYKDGKAVIAEINDCLQSNNLNLYVIRIHALKSAAANVGAIKISAAAKELESAGQRGDLLFIQMRSAKLITDLERMLKHIHAVLILNDNSSRETVDAGEVRDTLSVLRKALEDLDVAKINEAEKKLGGFPRSEGFGAGIGQVLSNILVGEYDAAIDVIDGMLN
jgi:CheY-like chemotaxis protein